jgi:DNA-binding NtrC family response regulator
MQQKPVGDREGVVVVHYDRGLGASLAYLLSSVGYAARVVDRSEQALEILRSEAAGVVVTSDRMSGMSAVEAARRFKSHPGVELIWISADITRPSFDAAVRLGVFDYVEIPFECGRFIECVGAALRRCGSRQGERFGPHVSEILALERQVAEANPLRRWRRRARLAATEAADSLGVDVATLAAWESGTADSADRASIARAIGVADLDHEWQTWISEHASRLPSFMRPPAELDVAGNDRAGSDR